MIASATDKFVDITVPLWGWGALLAFIVLLLVVDLVVFHKEAHVATTKEAAIESIVWISIGLAFTFVTLLRTFSAVKSSRLPAPSFWATSAAAANTTSNGMIGWW